jgi:hypothetical protein
VVYSSTMSRRCAFCPSTAKLSAEHIWSEWISAIQPGKKVFRRYDADGQLLKSWVAKTLDWTAKVVCEECNNTWMSDIEHLHAKPSLADLITGKSEVPIDAKRARSIALFCFKTTLVIDQVSPSEPPFFREEERYAFRTNLNIPPIVKIWMANFIPSGKGRVNSGYFKTSTSPADMIRSFVCTFAAGHFVFQLVAIRSIRTFLPLPGFENLAVGFYPRFQKFLWPPVYGLASVAAFESFSSRWSSISLVE